MTAPRTVPGRDCFAHFDADARGHAPLNAYLLALVSTWLYPSIVTKCEGCEEADAPSLLRSRLRHWGFGAEVRLISRSAVGRYDTQTVVAGTEEMVLVAFRGSETPSLFSSRVINAIRDWLITDADIAMVTVEDLGGKVDLHRGFWRAFMAVAEDIDVAVRGPVAEGRSLWITGHSLGGALATLAAPWLCARGAAVGGVYTFGAPMVGGPRLAQLFEGLPIRNFHRYVYEGDAVPRLPPEPVKYQHATPARVIAQDGSIRLCETEREERPSLLHHPPRLYCEALYDALTDEQKQVVPPPPSE